MRTYAVQLLIALVLLMFVGCAVQRHLDAGDTAATTGDMRGALYHYQQALGSQESLARDRAFMQKLAMAESRVAFDEAVRLRAGGDYEEAIEHLRHAIDKDPAYLEPQQVLPMVLAQASQVRYVRAVESADAGKLHEAQLHLELALQQDMRNEQAAFARASLSLERLPGNTPGLADYHAATA